MERSIEIREMRRRIPLEHLVESLSIIRGISECRIDRDGGDPRNHVLQISGEGYNPSEIYSHTTRAGYAIIPATKLKTIRSIGIKSEGAEYLDAEYFKLLLHDKFQYPLRGDFTVESYFPSQNDNGTGIVTIVGDFDFSEICAVLVDNNFTLTNINKKEELESPDNLEVAFGEK